MENRDKFQGTRRLIFILFVLVYKVRRKQTMIDCVVFSLVGPGPYLHRQNFCNSRRSIFGGKCCKQTKTSLRAFLLIVGDSNRFK
jgi:hypothetical protein